MRDFHPFTGDPAGFSPSATSGRSERIMIPHMIVCSCMPAYGYAPVHSSHMSTANEYTSTFSDALVGAFNSSGAVHGNVPRCELTPLTNDACDRRRFESPKSHTLHCSFAPRRAVRTLSHFRSKCTKRFECRYAMPRATSNAHLARSFAPSTFFDGRSFAAAAAGGCADASASVGLSPASPSPSVIRASSLSFSFSTSRWCRFSNRRSDPLDMNSSTIPNRSPSFTTP
mmetsp:Transcript_7582/g.27687  ORF Transcript_7582/g.27687 Transcript_7582/m.27687 type:complete len:228 (+) Transcript_7582:232-915(+)